MVELYRNSGLDLYEKVHYSKAEHIAEVDAILQWYPRRGVKVLDIGCSGGLHALDFARRGFRVAGFDIEPSAIRRARKRNRDRGLGVCFRVLDLERGAMTDLGRFDLIYSIANVMAHVYKYRLIQVLRKIRECLEPGGILLFDVLVLDPPFRQDIYDRRLNIRWKRRISAPGGKIFMEASLADSGMIQRFDVWGYYLNEICEILQIAGFDRIEYSDRLDFARSRPRPPHAVSLFFRIGSSTA